MLTRLLGKVSFSLIVQNISYMSHFYFQLYQVVQKEIEELPEAMQECSMIYVPHIGYMLAIQPWCVNGQLVTEFGHLEGKTPDCLQLDS